MRKGANGMNKKDKELLEQLKGELNKAASEVKVPERLQKDNIVAMLNESKKSESEKDFSAKTGYKDNNIIVLRRITAVAAMLVIVIGAVLLMKPNRGPQTVVHDPAYEGFELDEPIKSISSYDEVEQAVRKILEQENSTVQATLQEGKTEKNNDSSPGKTSVYVAAVPETPVLLGQSDVSDSSEKSTKSYSQSADIVKNDGKYLYIVTAGVDAKTGRPLEQIKIVSALPADDMKVVSTVVLSDPSNSSTVDECFEIYLKGNKLIALMKRYDYSMTGSSAASELSTVAVYYDISDPTSPVKIREHVQDGSYITSKLYGSRLCIITAKSINNSLAVKAAGAAEKLLPSLKINGKVTALSADNVFISVNSPEASYLFITVTNLDALESQVGSLAVLGSGSEIYCSPKAVYISREFVSTDKGSEYKNLTEIYRFAVSGTSVKLSGSYTLEGSVLKGLSVDEENDLLHIAASDDSSVDFYVLNDKMEYVGGVKRVCKSGAKSVKFIGKNAYVVESGSNKTKIVDFSEPRSPKVAGSINTGGFAGELFSVSDTKLIGIRLSDAGGATITLIDVTDPNEPTEVGSYALESTMRLPSANDSRGIMLIADTETFGIPVVSVNAADGTSVSSYMLFSVADGKITPVGAYNHDAQAVGDTATRAAVIGDNLYTISGEKAVAFSIKDCSVLSSVKIK